MSLPLFRYHPDPIGTASIVDSNVECMCCGKRSGYISAGPVFSKFELNNSLCPWCIADGSAHRQFRAEFTDLASIGENHSTTKLGLEIIETVSFRTPGFTGWQQERWLACCNDAAAFVGHAGYRELNALWPGAIASIKIDSGFEGIEWEKYFRCLDSKGSPTGYVFRCLHCDKYMGYQDCD
jgi:uncharacterized protein